MTITSINNSTYLLIRSEGRLQNERDLFKHAELVYNEFKKHNNKRIILDALSTDFYRTCSHTMTLYRFISGSFLRKSGN